MVLQHCYRLQTWPAAVERALLLTLKFISGQLGHGMAKASEATIHVMARPLLTWTVDLKAIIEVRDACLAFACLALS